jgi:aspartate racemase
MPPLIGVLGGMGPLAGVDLMQKMIRATAARSDQEQIPVLCWNVPQVPDRQRALAGAGTSPLPAMLAGIAVLNAAGATRIVIACNTAHYWFEQLAAASAAPLIHIADATLAALPPGACVDTAVGLLATRGTIDADLYQSRLAARGVSCIVNTEEEFERYFTPGCYAVKQGHIDAGAALLQQAAQALLTRGARQLLLACTEVPLALAHIASPLLALSIDPTWALAQECARYWHSAAQFE